MATRRRTNDSPNATKFPIEVFRVFRQGKTHLDFPALVIRKRRPSTAILQTWSQGEPKTRYREPFECWGLVWKHPKDTFGLYAASLKPVK
jgi:hypothetical protein